MHKLNHIFVTPIQTSGSFNKPIAKNNSLFFYDKSMKPFLKPPLEGLPSGWV